MLFGWMRLKWSPRTTLTPASEAVNDSSSLIGTAVVASTGTGRGGVGARTGTGAGALGRATLGAH
jgi:hypothetical protein